MLKAVETIEAVKGCRRAGYSSYYNAKNRGFLFTIYRVREREREELRAAVPIHICQPVQYTPPLLFSLALMNITPPPFSLSLSLSLFSVLVVRCSSGATTAYICAVDAAAAAHLNSCAPPSIPTPIVRGHC